MEVISECFIELHNAPVVLPYKVVNKDETFGLFNIKMKNTPIRKTPFHFVFTVDTTLSMSETDKTGVTKMEYMKETLKKMISYLESLEPDIYVTIYTFNTSPELLVNNFLLSKASVQFIKEFLYEVNADGSTNIEKALEMAFTLTTQIKEKNPEHQVAHIFMTDGEATVGVKDPNKLATLINTSIPNVFVGFGKNHNSQMLNRFAECSNCEYYFVDNLEHSVLVYAESVHNILYGVLHKVEYHIKNGKLYDYQTNEWTDVLYENVLSSESHKFYQLKTSCPENIEIEVLGSYENGPNEQVDVAGLLPQLYDSENDCLVLNDLTTYAYRQKVQGLLFSAKNCWKSMNIFSFDSGENDPAEYNELYREMREVFKTIQDYMKTSNQPEDPLLRMLCEDLYVTITAKYNGLDVNMYAEARRTSQGRQRSYNVGSSIPNTVKYDDIPILERESYCNDDILNYTMERNTTSCFATPTMLNTLRCVSQALSDDEDDDLLVTSQTD
jgi:Mg-chelatase subunit ChlD